jgi:hypothetical protein
MLTIILGLDGYTANSNAEVLYCGHDANQAHKVSVAEAPNFKRVARVLQPQLVNCGIAMAASAAALNPPAPKPLTLGGNLVKLTEPAKFRATISPDEAIALLKKSSVIIDPEKIERIRALVYAGRGHGQNIGSDKNPIVIGKDGQLIDGAHRLDAIRQFGGVEVAIVIDPTLESSSSSSSSSTPPEPPKSPEPPADPKPKKK